MVRPQQGTPVLGILHQFAIYSLAVMACAFMGCGGKPQPGLLNASYDPTRELWGELNAAFIPVYEKEKVEHVSQTTRSYITNIKNFFV